MQERGRAKSHYSRFSPFRSSVLSYFAEALPPSILLSLSSFSMYLITFKKGVRKGKKQKSPHDTPLFRSEKGREGERLEYPSK